MRREQNRNVAATYKQRQMNHNLKCLANRNRTGDRLIADFPLQSIALPTELSRVLSILALFQYKYTNLPWRRIHVPDVNIKTERNLPYLYCIYC